MESWEIRASMSDTKEFTMTRKEKTEVKRREIEEEEGVWVLLMWGFDLRELGGEEVGGWVGLEIEAWKASWAPIMMKPPAATAKERNSMGEVKESKAQRLGLRT